MKRADVMPSSKIPSPTQAAAALRDELLARDWPTSDAVGHANGANGQWAKDKRAAGELLGVWSANERTYRHPSFQFDASGILRPPVRDLLIALATHADFTPEADTGGWRRAFWLHGATLALAGSDGAPRVAADVFIVDPEAVICAARKDVDADPQERW
ncbi:hypothetical protein DVJ77_20845 [Dyella tabacisoli]|uniref:Uncharacterized protein n=1 Tax=Dyella tabacisoli TaxID=2282381 RepID=A0A369UGQ0_9GAMM|nr:hypothetical protein DVJ77_20845 [Dyella tabacisoli]